MGGESRVKDLVDRFYDLMDLDSEYAALRAVHGEHLDRARQHLFWFLCGWLGGPAYFTQYVGPPMLRARHLHFSIGVQERDQWMACMDRAMNEIGIAQDLREQLYPAFMRTADWMRNRSD